LAAVHAIGLCGLIACLLSYVSRMLEFEADDFVMEQVANATHPVSTDPGPLETRHSELPCDGQDLIQAIRKAGRLNGVDPDRITWMHPSIEQRIERIGWSQRSPVYRRLAGRRIKMLKLCLITATALLLGLLLLTNA
jgi:Zn-dependent protease with chaperone function